MSLYRTMQSRCHSDFAFEKFRSVYPKSSCKILIVSITIRIVYCNYYTSCVFYSDNVDSTSLNCCFSTGRSIWAISHTI